MTNKSITELLKDLENTVDKADIANETIRNGGLSTYTVYNEITKAKQICDYILKRCINE